MNCRRCTYSGAYHYSLFLVYYCIIMVKKEKDFG